MGGAASSYVGEVGSELVDILEERGVFKKMAYGLTWCTVKFLGLFTDEDDNWNHDVIIEMLVYGEHDLSALF